MDWQTVGWGQAMTDASYFLGGSLTLEDRRAHEQELLRDYHEALQEHGVRGFGWEECWEGYRRQAFLGVLMTVAPAMLVQRTERGDEMFLVTLARYAQQVLDLDALELLPEPGSGRPPALRPEAADEAPHEPGSEELWNESWYFDAVVRRRALRRVHAPGPVPEPRRLVDDRVRLRPRPADARADRLRRPAARRAGAVAELRAGLRAEHICIEPLESFEVRLQGRAECFRDAAGAPARRARATRRARARAALGHDGRALRLPRHDPL